MSAYVPKPIPEEVNVSKHSPLRQFFIFVSAILAFALALYFLLGIAVDYLAPHVPASVEMFIGDIFQEELCSGKNEEERLRLQQMVDRLTPHMGNDGRRLPYRVCIHDDDDIVNAAAFPGGRIVFFSGLLKELQTDEEIMFVLAHELGHFHHRDHLRRIGRELATVLLSALFTTGASDTPVIALESLTGVMNTAYSRDQERDADLFALKLLTKATGDAKGAVAFMRKLEKMAEDESMLYFFSTHPSPRDRREDIERAAEKMQNSG